MVIVVEEIIKRLRLSVDKYPLNELEMAYKNKGKINDLLLDEIRNWMKDIDELDYAPKMITYSFILLALFKDTRGYDLLIKLIEKEKNCFGDLFDDGLTYSLYLLIGEFYDGALDKYLSIIYDEKLDIYIRTNFVRALGKIYANNLISKDKLIELLKEFIKYFERDNYPIYDDIVEVVKRLKLEELIDDIKSLYDKDLIERSNFNTFMEDFNNPNITIEVLSIEEMKKHIMYDYYLEMKPIENPPKIGRNELCLCGSGKKYKKCCGK